MKLLDIVFHVVELIAAIAGTIYISKYREDKSSRYFVYFLWLTVLVETIGMFPRFVKTWDTLAFLRDGLFSKNAWLFNIYSIVSYLMYFIFFRMNLIDKSNKKILDIGIFTFLVITILNLIISDVFYETHSSLTMIFGTISLLTLIIYYFFQILQSDEILNFKTSLTFYIAVGALVLHLCITPLFIFSRFFRMSKSPEFVKIYTLISPIIIIFTYTCYTIGFIVCYRKNKSY